MQREQLEIREGEMSGKEKKAALEEKLQLLSSVTKSNAGNNKTSVLVDASKYIKELKDKVEAAAAASSQADSSGLLLSVLEAFEDLDLDVLDADVSCADDAAFRLQALGGSGHLQGEISVDEQMVRQAVLQAISKCVVGEMMASD